MYLQWVTDSLYIRESSSPKLNLQENLILEEYKGLGLNLWV